MPNTNLITTNDKNTCQATTDGGTQKLNSVFVNEECGDTMWDAVIKDAEERLYKSVASKPEETAVEKQPE